MTVPSLRRSDSMPGLATLRITDLTAVHLTAQECRWFASHAAVFSIIASELDAASSTMATAAESCERASEKMAVLAKKCGRP
jgi:hypothetical protein